MDLRTLLQAVKAIDTPTNNQLMDVLVDGLSDDSRRIHQNYVFVAVPGLHHNGHDYISDAVAQGAVAIVGEKEQGIEAARIPYIRVPVARDALADLAASFYGNPGRQLKVIGVTGTDGKTTTTTLIHAILTAASHKADTITSIKAVIAGKTYDTGFHVTTPDILDMQRYLAEMVDAGSEYAVLETTSHALAQKRTRNCEYDIAVVTNITHEHLDYHGTYDDYVAAKAELFRDLTRNYRKPNTAKVSILNADDQSYASLAQISADQHYTYGLNSPADFTARDIHQRPRGTSFTVVTPVGEFELETALQGQFNVYNILAAIATTLTQGVSIKAIRLGTESVTKVRGRMEFIDLGQDFTMIVDFAHTPNGLEKALKLARQLTMGKVIVVFGCAGLRDRGKRHMMGHIAGQLADHIVITAEDPRTEDLDEIMAQIATGCELAGRTENRDYSLVQDRAEAIAFAISLAQKGDLVITTGKAHEQSMCFGEIEFPWDEFEAVRQAIHRR